MKEPQSALVAAGTILAGISSWLGVLQPIFAAVTTLTGMTLSVVLIVLHVRKARLERRKLEIEIARLKAERDSLL